jgi:heme/copper-type cytochrome/quinol oxidase subunit 1
MSWSRSLLGRTSFLWAAGFFVLAGLDWAAARAVPAWRADAVLTDRYSVVQPIRYGVGFGVLFLAYALAYLALEALRRGPHRPRLGAGHVTLTLVGVALALAPTRLLTQAAADGSLGPPGRALEWLNAIALAGYVLGLMGQLFFVAVLIDAFRPEANPR